MDQRSKLSTDTARRQLIDPFGRRISYLRVSVTDRCNYRCFYCMPPEGVEWRQQRDLLTHEEMARLIRLFAELGVENVRLTGGEPLVRRNLIALIRLIGEIPGIRDLSMSTNAHLLERFAEEMREAGVSRVNISLDSLKPEVFREITRGGDLATVIRGIDAALAVGMRPVKLNMVVMKGLNDGEIEAMVDFAVARGADLRFIETMPVGAAGSEGVDYYYPAEKILERIQTHYGGELNPTGTTRGAGPARYYQVGDGPVRIGVITAMSRHFCETCNRVRLTAKGDLVFCLGKDDFVPLRDLVRGGHSDEALKAALLDAIARKPMKHDFLEAGQAPRHDMTSLGG
ncbi:MAG: GTP 3',8-cyclase MoaA [Gammaproteobacteria bacterium]